jgi:hypothetical protein
VLYAYLALQLNSPAVDTTDNYLDADNFTWMRRMTWADGHLLEMRGPHPYAYFIFRPIGGLFRLLLGNEFLAAVLMNSLAGAACVVLAWVYVRAATGSNLFAILIASLLGLSTAHLWFGAIIETYIFSAATLLLGYVLLQRTRPLGLALVLNSLVTFGITASNLVQHAVGFLAVQTVRGRAVRLIAAVLGIGGLLALLHAAWYPSSIPFFDPAVAGAEKQFSIAIHQEPGWRALGRAQLLVRTMALYSVVAPRPYVFLDEVGGTFPRFNFFSIAPGEYRFSEYDGLGAILVLAWAAALLLSVLRFLFETIRTRSIGPQAAFLLCLAFNFGLHMVYGYEPFLYSPDWTYALVLFVALAWRDLAHRRSLQAGVLAFLVVLGWNQFRFMGFVLDTVSSYLP